MRTSEKLLGVTGNWQRESFYPQEVPESQTEVEEVRQKTSSKNQ